MRKIIATIITSMIVLSVNVLQADLSAECITENCGTTCEIPARGFCGYYGIAAGANFLHRLNTFYDTLHSYEGFFVSAYLGHRFSNGLRVEGEFAFRRNELGRIPADYYYYFNLHRNGSVRSYSGMVNLLWEIRKFQWECCSKKFQPYIGAGIGCGFSRVISYNWFTRDINFNWQVMAGVFHAVTNNVEISLEYKFHSNNYFFNNSIGLGLKYFVGG